MMRRTQGFTLLEVSMVMVIIALIVAAISVGSSLIRNAEIQSINGEVQGHISAIKMFKDKYYALPGDFYAADQIFENISAGDGDGLVVDDERYYAWTHLSSAGLVEGSFTGASNGSGYNGQTPGINIPISQLSGAGWTFTYVPSDDLDLLYVAGDIVPGHVLWFGGISSTLGLNNTQNPVLSSEEADLLDRRLDDGLPGTGKIVAQINAVGTACTTSTSAYNLAASGKICSLVFKTGF